MASLTGPSYTGSQEFTDLTTEHLLTLQHAYRKGGVLADQIKHRGVETMDYDGNTLRFALQLNLKAGTSIGSETGTLPLAYNLNTVKGNVGIAMIVHVIQLSRRIIATTQNPRTAMAESLETHMDGAMESMTKQQNELLHGPGTGLIATVSGSTSASSSITQTIKVANANMDLLYIGRLVNVLVISGLTTTKLLVKIIARDLTAAAETITVNLASDDTATCSFSTSTANAIYVPGAENGSTNVLQGLGAATAQTGTFEGILRTDYPQFVATDGRKGNTNAADLGIAIFQDCVRLRGAHLSPGSQVNTLAISSQGVIDIFTRSLLTQSVWAGDKGTLDAGYEYVKYGGERIFADYDAPLGKITFVPLDDMFIAQIGDGPAYVEDDGNRVRFTSRNLTPEMWITAEQQAGYRRLDRFVYADHLNEPTV